MRAGCARPSARINWANHVDFIYDLIRGCNPAPGAWTTLKSEASEQKLYLFDAKKIMAPTFGAVRGKKLGEVVSAGPEGMRIHAQGGFIEVSRLRLGDGAKVKSSESTCRSARSWEGKAGAPARDGGLVEAGFDLLAEEPQRVHHPVLRDFAAAVQFGEDAVEADLLLDLAQPRGEPVGVVDQDLRRQRFVIGQGFEALDLAQPLHRQLRRRRGAPSRAPIRPDRRKSS